MSILGAKHSIGKDIDSFSETDSILPSFVIGTPNNQNPYQQQFSTPGVSHSMNIGSNAAGISSSSSYASLDPLSILRRLLHPPQLDFESSSTQMVYLLHSPRKVYKLASWRHQTKNQWARDDPAFLAMLCYFIIISTVSFYLAVNKIPLAATASSASAPGMDAAINQAVEMAATAAPTRRSHPILAVIVSSLWSLGLFFITGIVISSWCWHITNSRYRVRHSHSVEQEVEWLYAFDIHCNSFFPLLVLLGPIQYILLPLLLAPGFIPALIANSLYAIAFSSYSYITFLGYLYLPFLSKGHVTSLLYPIAVVVMVMTILSILKINISYIAFSIILHFS